MRIKKSSKRPVKASKHMKLGRNIMASTGKKIPYDLVSMAAILRDWADMPRDAYASDEHKLLADIADTLYNVGRSAAKTFKDEYAELYKQYGEAYFDQVLDDMAALDSQVSSNNIEELVEDYEDRLDSGIGAATKIKASRASRVMAAKRSIHFLVTVTDTDEIIDVLEDQDEAIEVARKYTQKYGDSATVEKEWIGSDGEVYDSTVCFQTDGVESSRKVSCSTKRRAVKASSWGIDDPRSDYLESKNFKKVVFNGRGQYDRGYTRSYMTADHRRGSIDVNPNNGYAIAVYIVDTNYVSHRIDIPSGIPTYLSPENYENDLAVIEDFLYNYDLNEYGYPKASTKITKRPIKAGRQVITNYLNFSELDEEQKEQAVKVFLENGDAYDWYSEDMMYWYEENLKELADEYSNKYGLTIHEDKLYWESNSQGPYPKWDLSYVFGNIDEESYLIKFYGKGTDVEVDGSIYAQDEDGEWYYEDEFDENNAPDAVKPKIEAAQRFIDEVWSRIEDVCRDYPDDEWCYETLEANDYEFQVDDAGNVVKMF